MAIKRKTHLNLSGSHHTLDSDNGFIGGTLYITGSLSASAGITGSIRYINGSTPFIVNGANITTNYNSLGQWEITGSGGGGSPAGSNTQIQFNDDGAFGASSLLAFNTASVGNLAAGTLSAPTGSFETISGSNTGTLLNNTPFDIPSVLLINSNTLVTNSIMLFDGIDPFIEDGGLIIQNGANIQFFSGAIQNSPETFYIQPGIDPDTADMLFRGSMYVITGAIKISENTTNALEIHSGTIVGTPPFYIKPSQNAGAIDLYTSSSNFNINGFNIVPLWNHATTSVSAQNAVLSGTLLSDNMPQYGVGLFDINVVAAADNNSAYGSWKFSVTVTSSAGSSLVNSSTELDNVLVGSNASTWDVNFNGSNIEVTGSNNTVYWMAKITHKMILSSSGQVIY